MSAGVLVLGAGGHGKVVADILRCAGVLVAGFLDDDPARQGCRVLGLPVLGPVASCAHRDCDGLALGIGANAARRAVVERLRDVPAERWVGAVHPAAVVADSAMLGLGVVIAAGAILGPECRVGDFAIVNTAATADHDCRIGCFAHLAPGSHLSGAVCVGEGTLVGTGTVAIPGCTIGAWAVVGAGAAVVADLPASCTAVGVPARVVKERKGGGG